MSSAFDAIDRKLLLDILKDILNEDEMRLVRFLLSDTNISIKIKGATDEMPFLADDVDFISMIKHKDVGEISKVLKKYKLLVNNDKTEYTTIDRKK